MTSPIESSPSPRWLKRILRDRSRSTSCSAGHDGAASSGASNSFSIQAEYRFSVPRFHVLRRGQALADVAVGRGGSSPRTTISRVKLQPVVARSRVRFTCHAPAGSDERKLASERFLNGDDDAQWRALPRHHWRRQDCDFGRVFKGSGGALGSRLVCRGEKDEKWT